ncbi:nitroreductase family protein [Candidatus Woesearchaeota archaeon]|nr:nitroreductase family protein [Candidatus Woesearchaeota archaeon]
MPEHLVRGGVARHADDDTPVIRAIKERRSVRSYLDVPVEWDKIIACVEAGMMAPNAGNLQIWRFVVVRGGRRKDIAEACLQQYWMEQAPVHIVIFAKLQKEEQYYGIRGTRLYSIQDCAMAAMNIMLAAHDLGLATCFVSAFDEEAVSRIFGQQEDIRPQGVITIGYSDEKPAVPLRYRVESLIGVESYGTAMNPEGVKGGGRIATATAIGTYRWGEGFPKYVQAGAQDFGKVLKHRQKKLFGKLKDRVKKKDEEKKNFNPS